MGQSIRNVNGSAEWMHRPKRSLNSKNSVTCMKKNGKSGMEERQQMLQQTRDIMAGMDAEQWRQGKTARRRRRNDDDEAADKENDIVAAARQDDDEMRDKRSNGRGQQHGDSGVPSGNNGDEC